MSGISLPLHSVISFSVINYVVSMRHPRVSDDVSFCFIYLSYILENNNTQKGGKYQIIYLLLHLVKFSKSPLI